MESGLSAEFIALLMEKAAKSGATSLKVGDVLVTFGEKSSGEGVAAAAPVHKTMQSSEAESSEQYLQADSEEIDAEDGHRAQEQQMAELILTDPLRYEEMLSHGELDGAQMVEGASS